MGLKKRIMSRVEDHMLKAQRGTVTTKAVETLLDHLNDKLRDNVGKMLSRR